MSAVQPFSPSYGGGQTVAPGAASAGVTIPASTNQLAITNLGANVAYVRVSADPTPATANDYPVPPNMQVVISKGIGMTNLSHISPAGTTLHIIPGEGM